MNRREAREDCQRSRVPRPLHRRAQLPTVSTPDVYSGQADRSIPVKCSPLWTSPPWNTARDNAMHDIQDIPLYNKSRRQFFIPTSSCHDDDPMEALPQILQTRSLPLSRPTHLPSGKIQAKLIVRVRKHGRDGIERMGCVRVV